MNPFPSQANKSRRAFTLIELLTVIAVIAVLAAILIPVVGNVRAKGYQTTSASNLRQLANAANMWSNDNGNRMVPNQTSPTAKPFRQVWVELLAPYVGYDMSPSELRSYFREKVDNQQMPEGVWDNPAIDSVMENSRYADYGLNLWVSGWQNDKSYKNKSSNELPHNRLGIQNPAKVIWMGETSGCNKNLRGDWAEMVATHPGDTMNLVFVDGHVEQWTFEEASSNVDREQYPWGWPEFPK